MDITVIALIVIAAFVLKKVLKLSFKIIGFAICVCVVYIGARYFGFI